MKRRGKETAGELDAALGKPKYYIGAKGLKEGESYFWFPTLGSSMTDNTAASIPGGSLVLARLLTINTLQDIPLHRPVVVIIHDDGQQVCMLKCVCGIMEDNGAPMLCFHSYNPRHEDFRLPFSCVKFIFVVEKVRRPDGSEFAVG